MLRALLCHDFFHDLVALEVLASEHEMMRRSPTFFSFECEGQDIGNARFIQALDNSSTITASRSSGWRPNNFSRTASALFSPNRSFMCSRTISLFKPAFMRL